MTEWPITKTSLETYIDCGVFELYVGDTADLTPEEWETIRLISQAPALLEACKNALHILSKIDMEASYRYRLDLYRNELRAAIAQVDTDD